MYYSEFYYAHILMSSALIKWQFYLNHYGCWDSYKEAFFESRRLSWQASHRQNDFLFVVLMHSCNYVENLIELIRLITLLLISIFHVVIHSLMHSICCCSDIHWQHWCNRTQRSRQPSVCLSSTWGQICFFNVWIAFGSCLLFWCAVI